MVNISMSYSKDHHFPLGDHPVKVSREAVFISEVTHLLSHCLLLSPFPKEVASGRKVPCENFNVLSHRVAQSVPALLNFEPRFLGRKKYSAYGNVCT